MFPAVYSDVIQQSVKLANIARQLYQNTTGSILVTGRSIVIDQPKNFEPGAAEIAHDHDPSDLTGEGNGELHIPYWSPAPRGIETCDQTFEFLSSKMGMISKE